MSRSLTILDDFLLNARSAFELADDDCPECQGIGEVEGEAVNRNGPYSVVIDCPVCKGSGKIEIDPYTYEEE